MKHDITCRIRPDFKRCPNRNTVFPTKHSENVSCAATLQAFKIYFLEGAACSLKDILKVQRRYEIKYTLITLGFINPLF